MSGKLDGGQRKNSLGLTAELLDSSRKLFIGANIENHLADDFPEADIEVAIAEFHWPTEDGPVQLHRTIVLNREPDVPVTADLTGTIVVPVPERVVDGTLEVIVREPLGRDVAEFDAETSMAYLAARSDLAALPLEPAEGGFRFHPRYAFQRAVLSGREWLLRLTDEGGAA